jgi:hypothetical protein
MTYKSLICNSYLDADVLLNQAAQEGWQLVTALVVSGTLVFYLKK